MSPVGFSDRKRMTKKSKKTFKMSAGTVKNNEHFNNIECCKNSGYFKDILSLRCSEENCSDLTNFINGYETGSVSKYFLLDNVNNLDDRREENVADFIKYRFLNKQTYTWAGKTLIAVHPYEEIRKALDKENISVPNIESVVARTWFNLSNNVGKANQCIVISGESGSGKTYSACMAIRYLASKREICNPKVVNNVLAKSWHSVPLLAAFGNASTVHNFNSSRFGKLLQLQYRNGRIIGAFIQTYLLERSRVSGPNQGETNFHIFNQVLENLDESVLSSIHLDCYNIYRIAPKSNSHRNHHFEETLKALEYLNIEEIQEILKVLSLILNLGNVDFVSTDDQYAISDESQKFLENCAKILECNCNNLSRLFVKRLIAAKLRRRTICYTYCVNIEECIERRNIFMRFVYERLFLWLIEKINLQIFRDGDHKLLGILDIYGFETFENNTFEQLCINYANERLQQYYMTDFYVKQQAYLDEKGDVHKKEWDVSEYKERISLLDGTLSVFGILNEECLVKRYNSDVFVNTRICNALKNRPHFVDQKNNFSTKFSIKHYAGVVEYSSTSMVNKNRDKVPDEMLCFLESSNFFFLASLVDSSRNIVDGKVAAGKTLLSKFKKSLDDLMRTLDTADVHYIKCLKPNLTQSSGIFDKNYFISQLRYNGIMEVLNLDFQNYSVIINKEDFDQKYSFNTLQRLKEDLDGKIFIGCQNIYFRDNGFNIILKHRAALLDSAVKVIQRCWRQYNLKRIQAAKIIQKFYRNSVKRCNSYIDRLNFSFGSFESAFTVVEISSKQSALENCYNSEDSDQKDSVVSSDLQLLKMRKIFRTDHLISTQKLAQVPVRFHLKKTCLPFSHIIPISEVPKGLTDIF